MRPRLLAGWRKRVPTLASSTRGSGLLRSGRSVRVARPAPDDAFVSDHCTSCHDDVSQERTARPDKLAFDPSDSAKPGSSGSR